MRHGRKAFSTGHLREIRNENLMKSLRIPCGDGSGMELDSPRIRRRSCFAWLWNRSSAYSSSASASLGCSSFAGSSSHCCATRARRRDHRPSATMSNPADRPPAGQRIDTWIKIRRRRIAEAKNRLNETISGGPYRRGRRCAHRSFPPCALPLSASPDRCESFQSNFRVHGTAPLRPIPACHPWAFRSHG